MGISLNQSNNMNNRNQREEEIGQIHNNGIMMIQLFSIKDKCQCVKILGKYKHSCNTLSRGNNQIKIEEKYSILNIYLYP